MLRFKIPLVVLLFVGLYALVFALVFRYKVRPSFDALDEESAIDSLDRVAEVLDREGRGVGILVYDNATWDETYQFAEDRNDAFIAESMTPQTFPSRGIDFAWIANASGQVLWSWPDGPIPFSQADFAAMGSPMTPDATMISGLVATTRGLALVGVSEIHDNDGVLPSRGLLLFGRLLTPERIAAIGEATPVPFALDVWDGTSSADVRVDAVSDDLLAASKPLVSIAARPVAVARVSVPRSVAQQGRSLETRTFAFVVAAGVLLAALLALVLRLLVVNPLATFGRELRHIREGARDTRLVHGPNDELGQLVREINEAMDSLRSAERGRDAAVLESEELERRVLQRTQALTEANERLRDEIAARTAVEKLREADAQQQHAMRLQVVGRLAGGVAHDFNNILQAIRGCAEYIGSLPREEAVVVEESRIIVRESERAAGLVRQLLAFSRRGRSESVAVDLGVLLEEVASLLSRTVDRRLVLETHVSATRRVVQGDPNQLRSALLNLALNARDAMPDGGRLELRLADVDRPEPSFSHLEPTSRAGLVCVTVSDNGMGISDEAKGHLFEPFFTTKEARGGSGLGLAAVYGIAQTHSAGIDVVSTVGRGTSISLFFAATAESVPSPQAEPEARPGSYRVLFVDDEPALCRIAQRVLRRCGHSVVIAADGLEALELFERDGPFDVVVLDAVMPRLDGYATLARLSALRPDVRVVLQSGGNLDPAKDGVPTTNVHGVLTKPFSGDALAQAVARAGPGPDAARHYASFHSPTAVPRHARSGGDAI